MDQRFCPHLGAPLEDETRGPAQDYPSFENRCYAVERIQSAFDEMEREQLLIVDQATYCLGSGHKLCPRFRLLAVGYPDEAIIGAGDSGAGDSSAGDSGTFNHSGAMAEGAGNAIPGFTNTDMLLDFDTDDAPRPRLGLWIGVASLFMLFLLCGGSLAIYTGWQLVGSGLLPIGQRLAQVSAPPQQNQIFLLVTPTPATSPTPLGRPTVPILAQAVQPASLLATPEPTFEFPRAVTATPTSAIAALIRNNTANDNQQDDDSVDAPVQTGPVVITTPTPPGSVNTGAAPSDPALATAVTGPVAITAPGDLAAPTRRPTPAFVVPTSTPGDPSIVVVTATPTPVVTYPPALIEFRSAHQFLPPQGCTTLFWRVDNVRAVFLDNEGVFGQGERRACIQWASATYNLSVLRLDGVEENRSITVEVRIDTPTPTPTFTPTPVLTPTPTWTTQATSLVTPETPQHGVTLTVDGGNQRSCTPGQVCEVVIQVSNTGPLADEIFLDLVKDTPWPVQFCRGDSFCGETSISIGVGPGGQLPVFLRAAVPADGAGQSFTFEINAASGNSNRTVRANPVFVTLVAQ